MTLPHESQSLRELAEKAALDLEALRVAAEGATPGPWEKGDGGSHGTIDHVYCDDSIGSAVASTYMQHAMVIRHEQQIKNAAFIAAANPSTILQLIARLEASERDGARYRWLKSGVFDCMHLVDETQMTAKNGQVIYVSMIGPEDVDQIADAAIAATKESA